MRFPYIPIMYRLLELVDELQRAPGLKPQPIPIEYYFDNENSTFLYNEVLIMRTSSIYPEDFHVPHIPPDYGKHGVTRLVDNALNPFVNALADDFKTRSHAGWDMMMKYDIYQYGRTCLGFAAIMKGVWMS